MVIKVIKRLIFDLDNTLIMWKPEYINALAKALKDNKNNNDPIVVNALFQSYENNYHCYDKALFLSYMNSKLTEPVNEKTFDDFLNYIGFMSEPNEEVIDTLEYLKDKYEMVVLTRWFTKPQIERLKNAHILKYFNAVVGGDEIMKPHPDAFKLAMGDKKPHECVTIGDTYDIDLIPAQALGIKPIFANFSGLDNKNNYQMITTFSELKDIL